MINQVRGLISESSRTFPIKPEVKGSKILTIRKASKSATNIAIADSKTKNKIIFFLSDPNIFLTETSFALLKDRAVLIFTKLKQAISIINKPIPENKYICLMLPFSPSS